MSRHDDLLALIAIDTDECVPWPYGVASTGYGAVRLDGAMRSTHVIACRAAHGERPGTREAAHSCGNRRCVNPRHLRWATSAENSRDALAHGRTRHKLTPDEVRAIRAQAGQRRQQDIAADFAVSQNAVSRIHRRRTWAWLDADLAA